MKVFSVAMVAILGVVAPILSINATAAVLAHVGTITQVATETRTNSNGTPLLGGCYAKVSVASPHAECSQFVNFACMGPTAEVQNVGSKSENVLNYNTVQLAYVTGQSVRLASDNAVIINGSCYVRGVVVSD